MHHFQGKIAVITGAASGIGRALAHKCAAEGMKLALADVDEPNLAQAAAELQSTGAELIAVPTDVSRRADVERLAARTLETFSAVHLLFNNAGVAAGGAPWEATWNDWEWVVGVNLWGVLHGVKIFTPLMLAQDEPAHIVNTASAAGLINGGGSAPYATTKHAVVALSESLYASLRQRNSPVHVSVLCPGMVSTNIDQAERHRPGDLKNEPAPLTPAQQAGLAAFKAALAAGMPPAQLANLVFDAIREQRFYIFTHPEWMELVQLRAESLLRLENPPNPLPVLMKILARAPLA